MSDSKQSRATRILRTIEPLIYPKRALTMATLPANTPGLFTQLPPNTPVFAAYSAGMTLPPLKPPSTTSM